MSQFGRYIGIDYSGAKTPTASLKGLRVYLTEGGAPPIEMLPRPSLRKYWSRMGIAEWLVSKLGEGVPTLVGIDHGFSFPIPYFEKHHLKPDWPGFLDDFIQYWPTDEPETWVREILRGAKGNARDRRGEKDWFRITETQTRTAKSVFNFDVKQGCVAYSTHAGISWLRFIRQRAVPRAHFWPFDGWEIPVGRSAVVEVYPALWNRNLSLRGFTKDQRDAYCIADELSRADGDGRLAEWLKPNLTPLEAKRMGVEGRILAATAASDR